MASIIILQFNMQRKMFLNILTTSVISIHFSQLVDHLVHSQVSHNMIEHTHAKILVSTCERQIGYYG